MKLPIVRLVKISDIDPAPFQPVHRAHASNIKELVASIGPWGIGLVQPLVVTKTEGGRLALVDGHRRMAACAQLGHAEVPVLEIDADQAIAFGQINGTSRKMSGFDTQEIYMQNPDALSEKARSNQLAARKYLGEDFCDEVVINRSATLTSMKSEVGKAMSLMERCPREDMPSPQTMGKVLLAVTARDFANLLRSKLITDVGKAKQLYDWADQYTSGTLTSPKGSIKNDQAK